MLPIQEARRAQVWLHAESGGGTKLRKAAGTVGKAAGTVTKKAAGTVGKAAGSVGSVTKAAGTEVTTVVSWLALMLAVETSVILKFQRPLAITAGVGIACFALAASSPWSSPLVLWRLLVKMGVTGIATVATAVAAGVTAGIAASGLFGIWRGANWGNNWGGVRGADVKTAVEFGVPAWVLAAMAGGFSSRTVALAPPLIQMPLRLALLALVVGGGGGSFCVMIAMGGASMSEDDHLGLA